MQPVGCYVCFACFRYNQVEVLAFQYICLFDENKQIEPSTI